ncbi:hypothetical protein QGN29_12435 [Temperatibacter marinus]|uniref:Heparan-alpha-glucosaminide N-acetyltransferase catalytic domain-containing protein n=1 Tax=Temperatibacter marinus TaxID=1456591 RepID=A0AA52EBL8_9PROT|nr:hypothetical protein [Temperatibacter marinus]WND02357.1 hypothetical protein QGN29_12435 [Temperatibacter marinus]
MSQEKTTGPMRLDSIDFMRGFVMIIMALDHVRDYVFLGSIDPQNLDETTPALFFSRWITNLCAPVFIVLAGLSVGIMAKRMEKPALTRFLLTRGLWLVFIEMTVISLGWNFTNFQSWFIGLQVICAIGVSMIALAGLIWLPRTAIIGVCAVILLGHGLIDDVWPSSFSFYTNPVPFYQVLTDTGLVMVAGIPMFVLYPIGMWVGVIAFGYLIAPLFDKEEGDLRRTLIRSGLAMLALFLVLRGFNLYGDPFPWTDQNTLAKDIMAFLTINKYPPSLSFLLVTLGISAVLMGLIKSYSSPLKQAIITLGRVPFFYYILHIYLIHLIALIMAEIQGFGYATAMPGWWLLPPELGVNLYWTWVIWIAVVIGLYPACKWFAGVKKRNKHITILKYL